MTGCDQRAVGAALRARGVHTPNRGPISVEEQMAAAKTDEQRRVDALRKSQDMLLQASYLDGEDAVSKYLMSRGIQATGCNDFKTIMVGPDYNLPPGKCMIGMICDLTTLLDRPIRSTGISMLSLTNEGEAKIVGGKKFRSIVGTQSGFGVPFGRAGTHMVVAEGFESAASALQLIEGADFAVATLSAANMAALAIPAWVQRVTIAVDNDKPGLAAAAALKKNIDDMIYCGIQGWNGPEGWDANDELMKRRGL